MSISFSVRISVIDSEKLKTCQRFNAQDLDDVEEPIGSNPMACL